MKRHKNRITSIVVDRDPKNLEIKDVVFYLEGSKNPFCPEEFEMNSITRKTMDKIWDLIVDLDLSKQKEE